MTVKYQLVGAGVDLVGAYLMLQHSGGTLRLPVSRESAEEMLPRIGQRVVVEFRCDGA